MDISEQPKLRFNGVDFLHVVFNVRKKSSAPNTDIQFSFVPHVLFPKKEPTKFKIIMEINIGHPDIFDLEILAVGNFETNKEIDVEIKKTLVNQNAVAILFPYIRSFIATFTSNIGSAIQPIIIPVHFFKGEIDEVVEPEENIQIDSPQLELK
jgi:Preprotein translocase subunit SecB.